MNWPDLAWYVSAAFMATGLIGAVCANAARRLRDQEKDLADLRKAYATQGEQLAAVQRDLTALLTCARRLGDRVGQHERTQRVLRKQLDQVMASDEAQVAVQHAIKLLSSGVDMKNVTDICELSEGEVEILQNLARHQHAG